MSKYDEGSVVYVVGGYEVRLGKSNVTLDGDGLIYQIVNEEFGVVEAETSSFPRAIMAAQSSDYAVKHLTDNEFDAEEVVQLENMLDQKAPNGPTQH